ncbi:MAG: hypothetical protein AAGA48_18120 [Myxococcota bacterium]
MSYDTWRILQVSALPSFAYIMGCPRTGACVVVNPTPDAAAAIRRQLLRFHFTVRFVLHTRRPVERRLPATGNRPPRLDPDAPNAARMPGPAIRVAPDALGRLRGQHDAVILRAGARRVGVRRYVGRSTSGPWYTIGGTQNRGGAPAYVAGQARIAVGAGFIDVLPLSATELVYRVPGHLFTGRPASATPPVLLEHDPDTLIHPGALDGGQFVSTVAQEEFRRAFSRARTMRSRPQPRQTAPHDDDELPVDVP